MSIVRCLIVAALSLALLESAVAPGRGSAPARQAPQDDDDDAALRDAMARRSLEENCLICHTEDMISGQRLSPAQWKAEVDKMLGWGAPLPKESAAPLVEYLAKRYSDREAPPVPTRARLQDVDSYEGKGDRGGPVPGGVDPARGDKLYTANCATCHGPTALGADLGPALVGKAILDHPDDYNRIVNQGLRRMPGTRLIMNAKDQADVLAWLRHRSYP